MKRAILNLRLRELTKSAYLRPFKCLCPPIRLSNGRKSSNICITLLIVMRVSHSVPINYLTNAVVLTWVIRSQTPANSLTPVAAKIPESLIMSCLSYFACRNGDRISSTRGAAWRACKTTSITSPSDLVLNLGRRPVNESSSDWGAPEQASVRDKNVESQTTHRSISDQKQRHGGHRSVSFNRTLCTAPTITSASAGGHFHIP